ncbi:MAG: hypothetical protein KatS3mg105_0192 [Gemmatales bacterium]|nr:MAG: hypothetical protein KatS3mg105_0192 [Gemmatales bacterium]
MNGLSVIAFDHKVNRLPRRNQVGGRKIYSRLVWEKAIIGATSCLIPLDRKEGVNCTPNGGLMKNLQISRRTVLKGLGTAIALPWLEAMAPLYSIAAGSEKQSGKPPRRMAFFYVPNGVHMKEWTPRAEGSRFDLPSILQPLAPVRDELLVLTGLTCDKARPNGDGPGDHARAMAAFLTGCQAKKTHGADIRAGVSVDQVCAMALAGQTRFASLELGCDRGLNAGNCDSGYSCAYSNNLSWRTPSTPMSKEVNPRALFDRLFGNGEKRETAASRAKRDLYRKSILDFVADDARRLKARLGSNDQQKLEEYLTGVREIEQRIARTGEPEKGPDGIVRPSGIPQDYAEHIRILEDLLILAFQGDLTRIATFVYANEGSNRSYRMIGVPEGHHDLSHHGGKPEKLEKIRKINHFHMQQFAYFLKKLKSIREGDGTLLDNCMILYGSGNSDGNRHNHDDLPILLVGKGGGTLHTGRHVCYPRNTPLTNLYLAMLERMGVPRDSFGDSTGKLEGL